MVRQAHHERLTRFGQFTANGASGNAAFSAPCLALFCTAFLGRLLRRLLFRLLVVAEDAFQGADFERRAFLAAGDDGDGAEGHIVLLGSASARRRTGRVAAVVQVGIPGDCSPVRGRVNRLNVVA